jgi:purine-binding chemotaxis protein CheW
MVDLVKIRKKAKKNAAAEEQEAASGGRGTSVIPSGSEGPGREGGAQAEAKAGSPSATSDQRTANSEQQSTTSDQPPAASDQRAANSQSKLDRFKETAGKRREGFISSETVAATGELLELLTFHIAGEQYALDIEHIVEIVPPREATRVPNADDSIVGIISLRGTIVTIVDVRRHLRHGSTAAGRQRGGAAAPEARVVVVQYGSETVGFEVDRVLRVVKVDRAAVEPHPVVHSSEQSEAIRGVFRQANALTILLDFDKLLDARHGTYL